MCTMYIHLFLYWIYLYNYEHMYDTSTIILYI